MAGVGLGPPRRPTETRPGTDGSVLAEGQVTRAQKPDRSSQPTFAPPGRGGRAPRGPRRVRKAHHPTPSLGSYQSARLHPSDEDTETPPRRECGCTRTSPTASRLPAQGTRPGRGADARPQVGSTVPAAEQGAASREARASQPAGHRCARIPQEQAEGSARRGLKTQSAITRHAVLRDTDLPSPSH